MKIHSLVAYLLFIGLSCAAGFANADYNSSLSLTGARSSVSADQAHKDRDTNAYRLDGRYYLSEVAIFDDAWSESGFVSRNAYVFTEFETVDRTPKDDYKLVRLGFDGRINSSRLRWRLGAVHANHEAELSDDELFGGLLGVGYHYSRFGLLTFQYEQLKGDGYDLTDLTLEYQLFIDGPSLDYKLNIYFEQEDRNTPHYTYRVGDGRIYTGWGGILGFFVGSRLQLGLGLRSLSIDYNSGDDGAFNALSGFAEYSYQQNLFFEFKATAAKESIDRGAGLTDVTEQGLGLEFNITKQF